MPRLLGKLSAGDIVMLEIQCAAPAITGQGQSATAPSSSGILRDSFLHARATRLFDAKSQRGRSPESGTRRAVRPEVARAMRVRPLPREAPLDLRPYRLDTSTPLWFYVPREAEKLAFGKRLGRVGGRTWLKS